MSINYKFSLHVDPDKPTYYIYTDIYLYMHIYIEIHRFIDVFYYTDVTPVLYHQTLTALLLTVLILVLTRTQEYKMYTSPRARFTDDVSGSLSLALLPFSFTPVRKRVSGQCLELSQ